MKTLKQIREASGGKEAYQKFFNSILKKFGVSSPSELKGDKKKEFYNAIDKGWESDDPNDKNERYEDPDNLDPETTVDSDEDMADKAASQVTEASKLKAGRGKITVDLNWDASDADAKAAEKKYKIKLKITRTGALATGDKKNVLAYIQSDDYGMDDEDIEDLMPEILESNYPKPLSIIRQQNEFSGDAETVRRKKRRFEKMAMCEHCGKTHEEGACGVHEANRFSKKLNKPAKKIFDLALHAIRRNNVRGKKDQDEYVDDVAGVSLTPKEVELVKQAIQHESVEVSEVYSRAQMKKAIGIARKSGGQYTKAYKAIEKIAKGLGDEHIIAAALKRANEDLDLQKTGDAGTSKSVEEGFKKAYPVMDQGQRDKIIKIAKANSGNMAKAIKLIDKIKKGLSDNPDVMDLLKKANEAVDVDGRLIGFKSASRRAEGEKQKGKVIVDRRTKGYKEAKVRSEKAKAKRLEAKKQKEFAEKYPEIDYAYGDAAELRNTIEAASKVLMGETAPNNVGDGNVDMNTTGKSKKKKKELMAKRGY